MHYLKKTVPPFTSHVWPRLGQVALGAGLLLLAFFFLIRFFGYNLGREWVESSEGQNAAEHALSQAIKVDGTLTPLHLQGWQLTTDSFMSTGWPGEAISRFDADHLVLKVDPWAVFCGAWRVKNAQIDHATISLRPPNDALKRPTPPKKPRAWYAFLLPNHFECGPITTPDANLEYTFRNQNAEIEHAQLEADLIGKDFQYTATSGTVTMPYFPPLRIEKLVMLVTRPSITISRAELGGLDPSDPAHLSLHGLMGMRENKTIDAHITLTEMPISAILPPNLQPLLHGRATGTLDWTCDATGKQISSQGTLVLDGAGMDNLSLFRELSVLHNNPDLNSFTLDQASCNFSLKNEHLHLTLQARAAQKFNLDGDIDYTLADEQARLNLTFRDLPLQTWLPAELKPGTSGTGSANVNWNGSLATLKDSTGSVALHLNGAQIALPDPIRHLLAAKRLRAPDSLQLQQAELDFDYHDQTFFLKQGTLTTPNQFNAQLKGSLTSDQALQAKVNWQGFKIEDWLPPDLVDQFRGDIDGDATLSIQKWKMERGTYAGAIVLKNGQLSFTSLQVTLARFLNRRELLDLPLTHATFSWLWQTKQLNVEQIDLRAAGHFGLQGHLQIDAAKNLSGTLWVGLRPEYLKSFYGLADDVFTRKQDGLCWAEVQVSGTVKNPQQNLSEQLTGQLWKHPFSVFSLGAKISSWYLGNVFGADQEWSKPAPAQ